VFLSRAPRQCRSTAFDLHALGTPPAFVLSQDQTLHDVGGAALARPRPRSTSGPATHDSVVKVPSKMKATKNQGMRTAYSWGVTGFTGAIKSLTADA
jgi:hypothetical protein